MIEYGTILGSSFVDGLNESWHGLSNLLGDIPYYWYIIVIIALAVFVRLLTSK